MYKLTINYYICNGPKSCGRCEEHIPGFLSEHGGEIIVGPLDEDNLKAALKDCPSDALLVEEEIDEELSIKSQLV